VPSIGGGTKLIGTLLAGNSEGVGSGVGEGGTDCSGEMETDADSPGVGEGVAVGDSCAAAIAAKATHQSKIRILKRRPATLDLSIVAPVHVRENIVPPFAVPQKFFIDIVCERLIVQPIEAGKVIDCALSGVFPRSVGFD
jgi:hypothetical protein